MIDLNEMVPSEPVATAAARAAMLRGWAIPLYTLPIVVGLPIILTVILNNAAWLVVIAPLVYLVRSVLGDDPNRIRVVWLSYLSGQMFADRKMWGGATRDPLDV